MPYPMPQWDDETDDEAYQPNDPNAPSPPPQGPPDDTPNAQLPLGDTKAQIPTIKPPSRMQDLSTQMPTREKPSLWRKIAAAGLAGAAGYANVDRFSGGRARSGPIDVQGGVDALTGETAYQRKMKEYGQKLGIAKDLDAQDEKSREADLRDKEALARIQELDENRASRVQNQTNLTNDREQANFGRQGGQLLPSTVGSVSNSGAPLNSMPPPPDASDNVNALPVGGSVTAPAKSVTVNPDVPAGYNQVPPPGGTPSNYTPVIPTTGQRAKEVADAKRDSNEEGWMTVPPEWPAKFPHLGLQAGQKIPPHTYDEIAKAALGGDGGPKPTGDFEKVYLPAYARDNFGKQPNELNSHEIDQALKAYKTSSQMPQQPPQPIHQGMFVPDGHGGQIYRELHPGDSVPAGAQTAAGVNAVSTPTSQMRGRGEMSKSVVDQAPRLIEQVQAIKDQIGPAAGRWHETFTNKVGANDPAFAALDQDLLMYASGVAVAHFGARGGQQYRQALEKNFGEAQSPEDLIARIQHADVWLDGYARSAGMHGGSNSNAFPPAAGGAAPPAAGSHVIHFDKNGNPI